MIKATSISYSLPRKTLLKPTSISFCAGEMAVIMGANGAGKSTLLKLLTAAIKPSTGQIFHKDKELSSYDSEMLAKERAVLSQSYQLSFPITVADIIMMGRYPYFSGLPTAHDKTVFDAVVAILGIVHLLDRDYNTLSGGEAQKVQMARVLAQVWQDGNKEPKSLYLDEPVSSLDIKYQHDILGIARQFANSGNAVVTVLHDINLAFHYADRIYFMKEGAVSYSYTAGQTIDLDALHNVFDIRFDELRSASGRLFLVPSI